MTGTMTTTETRRFDVLDTYGVEVLKDLYHCGWEAAYRLAKTLPGALRVGREIRIPGQALNNLLGLGTTPGTKVQSAKTIAQRKAAQEAMRKEAVGR